METERWEKMKTNAASITDRTMSTAKRYTAAAVFGAAAFLASPEHILNSGAPIPTAFTMR
jgi:hypothetical protein